MDTAEYEVIWSGGEGLTTVGPQRRGVNRTIVEGDVTDWIELDRWHATHPRKKFAWETGGYAARVLDADTAAIPQWLYRWLTARMVARWSRVLRYGRTAPFPTCELCQRLMPSYAHLEGRRKAGRITRTFRTPYHRHVCDSCHALYRVARGTWRGATMLRPRVSVFTPEERIARRQALYRARYQRRKAARSAAALPPAPAARTPLAAEEF